MNGIQFVDWLNKYWPLIGFFLQAVFAWLLWSMRKMFATKDDLTAMTTKVEAIAAAQSIASGEVTLLKQKLDGLPTAEDVNEIKLSIAEIEGDNKAISANVGNM